MNRWGRIRVWLARRLLRGLPVEINSVAAMAQLVTAMQYVTVLTIKSGHLGRVTNVGTKLRNAMSQAIAALERRAA